MVPFRWHNDDNATPQTTDGPSGTHFRNGVEEGTKQGEHVGQWVVGKLLGQPVALAKMPD